MGCRERESKFSLIEFSLAEIAGMRHTMESAILGSAYLRSTVVPLGFLVGIRWAQHTAGSTQSVLRRHPDESSLIIFIRMKIISIKIFNLISPASRCLNS